MRLSLYLEEHRKQGTESDLPRLLLM